jgi:Fe-S cluster biosynthesis and repair protein YggX
LAEIDCRRCGQSKPGLERAPLPGKYGPVVMEGTCGDCWREWVEEQTRVINHEGLTPGLPEHRQVLYQRMLTYLKLE